MIDTDKYEGLNELIDRIIDSDEIGIDDLLADSMAVKKSINELLAEVKRLRGVMIYVEQRQPHPALEWALKEGLTLTEIKERIE